MKIQKREGKYFQFSRDCSKAIWTLICLLWLHAALVYYFRFGELLLVTKRKLFVSYDY